MRTEVMSMTNKSFMFLDSVIEDDESRYVAALREKMDSKDMLLGELSGKLKMPKYFGNNWDGLYDMLCDLSWIKERVVVIFHADLPRLPPTDMSSYLRLLAESAENWKPHENHELIIAFPKGYEVAVASYL
jgi:RNAse (barnase) inhibitor barstar